MNIENYPIIDAERIDPQKNIKEKLKKEVSKTKEKVSALSETIKKWWRGDAHTHSIESTRPEFGYLEGTYHILEILDYYEKLGLEFTCFTEHASKPGNPEKQDENSPICQSLLSETKKINEINKNKRSICGLSGVETNIFFDENNDPIVDIPNEVLGELDFVIGSRHAIKNEKNPDEIKRSLLAALDNPIDALGHPDRNTRLDDREISKKKADLLSSGIDEASANKEISNYWEEYWGIWPEILEKMAEKNVAFEINLNNPPAIKLVEMAAKSGVKFFINYDAHDFNQYKKEETEITKNAEKSKRNWVEGKETDQDINNIEKYKEERLQSGPGFRSIFRLARWTQILEHYEVTPERVINSSRNNLLRFLVEDRKKQTENLKNLKEKFIDNKLA